MICAEIRAVVEVRCKHFMDSIENVLENRCHKFIGFSFFPFFYRFLYLIIFNLNKSTLFDKTNNNYLSVMNALSIFNFSSFVNHHANEVAWLKARLESLHPDNLDEQRILQKVYFSFFKLFLSNFLDENNQLMLGQKKGNML